MNKINVGVDTSIIDVELSPCLAESPSVSTFIPEEEDSIRPLLSLNTNCTTPLTFVHPLMPCMGNDGHNSTNKHNEEAKAESSSSSGSSYGFGMNVPENSSTILFNKHTYKHLQNHNKTDENSNGHTLNGSFPAGKNLPSFVSWNWPLIRKCTFFFFMSSLLAMCAVVVAMIVTLPRICNPITTWYRGSIFYEIFPASFQDSDNDGIGDLRGLGHRIDYLVALGISAVRLNSIFTSPHYPDDFENVTSLMKVAEVLGDVYDVRQLSKTLHARNISLILDLPLYPFMKKLGSTGSANGRVNGTYTTVSANSKPSKFTESVINVAINYWIRNGVDGFYVKGLEYFDDLENLPSHLVEWKNTLGSNKVIILAEEVFALLQESQQKIALELVDLVDVYLDVLQNTHRLEERLTNALSSSLGPSNSKIWIHWSLGGVNRPRLTRYRDGGNVTLAATIMQLMLPGTPSIFYGDEIALQTSYDILSEHNETKHLHHLPGMQWPTKITQQFTNSKTLPWLPKSLTASCRNFEYVAPMVDLRERSPSLYKNAICKAETILPNTIIRHSYNDILVIERFYPRRNSFLSISNFSTKQVTLDISSIYYSGIIMLNNTAVNKIYFSDFTIGPQETIVVRLDK